MPAHRIYTNPTAADLRPFIWTSKGFGHAFQRALDAGGIVPIDYWGDSITDGVGATDPLVGSFLNRLDTRLKSRYGDGGSGYLPLNRATKTGTWTNAMGRLAVESTATAAASATWTVNGTTVAIPYVNAGVTGSFRYQVDGGSFTTVTTPSGLGVNPAAVFITGLAPGAHTIRVEWVSGTVTIPGLEARGAAGIIPRRFAISGRTATEFSSAPVDTRAVTWANASPTLTAAAGDPGFTFTDKGRYVAPLDAQTGLPADARITAVAADGLTATMSANATAGSSGTRPVALSLNPPSRETIQHDSLFTRTPDGFGRVSIGPGAVAILGFGVNDMSAVGRITNTEFFEDGIAAIVDAYADNNADTDIIMLINAPGVHPDRTRSYAAMAGAARSVAEGYGGAVVDMWGATRHSFGYAEATWDYFADTIHPSDAGHDLIAAGLELALA